MNKLGKIILFASLSIFLAIGIFLLTGHGGFAIKISNYLFFIICVGVLLDYFNYE